MNKITGFLCAAGAVLSVAMMPAIAGPSLTKLEFSVRSDAEGALPTVHVKAENGVWNGATNHSISLSFAIDAAVHQGRIVQAVIGVPGVYVGSDQSIAAVGQAVWVLAPEEGGRMVRRIDRSISAASVPTLSLQATAACNRLLNYGATTSETIDTEILGRARIAIAIEPEGAGTILAGRIVETEIIRFPISVVCDAETDPIVG